MNRRFNLNCVGGNRAIPQKYLLNPATDWEEVLRVIDYFKVHQGASCLRTIIWFTERDSVATPWLHVLLTDEEVRRIQNYAWELYNRGILLILALGFLWEALWIRDNPRIYVNAGPIPDNPYNDPKQIADAVIDGVWRLMYMGRGLPSGTRIDMYSEFMGSDEQKAVAQHLFPWLRAALKEALLIPTLSSIVETDGTAERAKQAFRWVAELGYGMPDFLDLHINDVPNSALAQHGGRWADDLRQAYNLALIIGEDDVLRERPYFSSGWISRVAPEEIFLWVD